MREVEKWYKLEMLSRLHGTRETWRLDRFKIGRGRSRDILGREEHSKGGEVEMSMLLVNVGS